VGGRGERHCKEWGAGVIEQNEGGKDDGTSPGQCGESGEIDAMGAMGRKGIQRGEGAK